MNNEYEDKTKDEPKNIVEKKGINLLNSVYNLPTFFQILFLLVFVTIGLTIGYLLFEGNTNQNKDSDTDKSNQGQTFVVQVREFLAETGSNSSSLARGLITILFAFSTVFMATILIRSVITSNHLDTEKRFQMGKEVLTIFIGILGTIIGFYFGSAPIDNKKVSSDEDTIKAITQLLKNNPTKDEVLNEGWVYLGKTSDKANFLPENVNINQDTKIAELIADKQISMINQVNLRKESTTGCPRGGAEKISEIPPSEIVTLTTKYELCEIENTSTFAVWIKVKRKN